MQDARVADLVDAPDDRLGDQRRGADADADGFGAGVEQFGERAQDRVAPLDRRLAGREDLDDQHVGVLRLGRRELEERFETRDHSGRERVARRVCGAHAIEQLGADLVVRGEERVLLALEVVVEGPSRYAGGADDRLDAHRRVPDQADDIRHRVEDPHSLVLGDVATGQAVASRRELVGRAALSVIVSLHPT